MGPQAEGDLGRMIVIPRTAVARHLTYPVCIPLMSIGSWYSWMA